MSDVTQLLVAIGRGDQRANAVLLPLLDGELRRLARQRMAPRAKRAHAAADRLGP